MIVCCDLDGVIADMNGPVLDRVNRDLGLSLRLDDLDDYHALETLVADRVLDPREYLDRVFTDSGLLSELPLILPALTMLRKIRGMVKGLHVVTAREVRGRPWVEPVTRAWLDGYGIPYDRLVFNVDKARYCRANGARYMIEDSPHHALACHELGIGVFLIDAPYNRGVEPRGGIWRVENPAQIPPLLEADLPT